MEKNKLLFLINNHFDLTWRRCFDREIAYKGDTFVSYSEIEDYYITDNLKYAQSVPGYRFQIESTAVVRKFIERHPEEKERIQKYLQEGIIYIPLSGDNIIDSNMVLGETLVRNFVSGKLWLEDHLGFSPDICTRLDAFGNCAQIPQIVNGCEGEWLSEISYCPLHGDIWEGMDGSRLKFMKSRRVGAGGGYSKYPPCPECRGDVTKRNSCSVCKGRGIDTEKMKKNQVKINVTNPKMLEQEGWGVIGYGGEEILPNEDIFNWILENQDKYDISFATTEMIRERMEIPEDAKVFKGELNPAGTGCYVSRIKVKQLFRESEYKLLNAEALCAMAAMDGMKYPKEKADKIWEKILFAAFHDSLTGTYVDAGYEELMDTFEEIRKDTAQMQADALEYLAAADAGIISVINPTADTITERITIPGSEGQNSYVMKDMKPYEIRKLDVQSLEASKESETPPVKTRFNSKASAKAAVLVLQGDEKIDEAFGETSLHETIENSRYRITADDFGILEIYDKKLGQVLSAAAKYRPGEWVLEHDEGSPWETYSDDRRKFRLAPYTRLVEKECGKDYVSFRFKTIPPMTYGYGVNGIEITTRVTLYEGMDRIEFSDDMYWDTINHRMRMAMPVSAKGDTLYEVPYGFMERKPYYKPHEGETYLKGWLEASGDWPAVNWAGVSGKDFSVALMNKGLPSYIIEDDIIFLSVVRSPSIPICLHEGRAYTMLDFGGMRDAGMHHHEFALTAYDCPLPESTVVADANGYQAGLVCVEGSVKNFDMPYVTGEGVRITTIKQAESGDGMVIRLAETAGKAGKVKVHIPACFEKVYETNLLERRSKELAVTDSQVELAFEPFKIKTLVCKYRQYFIQM